MQIRRSCINFLSAENVAAVLSAFSPNSLAHFIIRLPAKSHVVSITSVLHNMSACVRAFIKYKVWNCFVAKSFALLCVYICAIKSNASANSAQECSTSLTSTDRHTLSWIYTHTHTHTFAYICPTDICIVMLWALALLSERCQPPKVVNSPVLPGPNTRLSND